MPFFYSLPDVKSKDKVISDVSSTNKVDEDKIERLRTLLTLRTFVCFQYYMIPQ